MTEKEAWMFIAAQFEHLRTIGWCNDFSVYGLCFSVYRLFVRDKINTTTYNNMSDRINKYAKANNFKMEFLFWANNSANAHHRVELCKLFASQC